MTKKEIINFLRTRPGYWKEGGQRLHKILEKKGLNADVAECKEALYEFYLERRKKYEPIEKSVSLIKKQNQRLSDVNRIERKLWRSKTREENAISEYALEISNILKSIDFKHIKTASHFSDLADNNIFIVQLSDLHLNELIDLPNNKYDFTIASKRLFLYADRIIRYCKSIGSKKDSVGYDRRFN